MIILFRSSRLLDIVDDIAAQIPPDKNISNGKAEYGQITTQHISIVTLHFSKLPTTFSVAMVFYKPKVIINPENESKLSGTQLRDQKIQALAGEDFSNKVFDQHGSGPVAFQGAVKVSSSIVDFARNSCASCLGNGSAGDDGTQPTVVLALLENTDIFTDKNLESEKKSVYSPIISVTVSDVNGSLLNLPENITIHFPRAKVRVHCEQQRRK